MAEILIIRSASMQQLDLNLPAIQHRFNGFEWGVLTHEHGVTAVEKYSGVGNIYVYNHKSGFRFWRKAAQISGRCFDAVVVQTANASGNGYLNVLLLAISIQSKKIYICNPASEIKEIKKSIIILRSFLICTFKLVSVVLTLPITIVLLVVAVIRA